MAVIAPGGYAARGMIGHDASPRLTICVAAQNVRVGGWGAALFATLHDKVWNIWVGAFADYAQLRTGSPGVLLCCPAFAYTRGRSLKGARRWLFFGLAVLLPYMFPVVVVALGCLTT